MKHITIRKFLISLFLLNIFILVSIMLSLREYHFEKDTQNIKEILKPKFDIISYESSLLIDKKDFKQLQNILDFKAISNKLFKSICLVKNGTIILSSNRDCNGKKVSEINVTHYLDFKSLNDINPPMNVMLKLKTYNINENYSILFKLNYRELENFYKNSITENIYPLVIFSNIVFVFVSFMFYILFVKPIEKINRKIKSGKLNNEDYILEELNTLDTTYVSQLKKIKSLSYMDELTQTYNRKSYNKRITENISLYNRYKTPFTILMYDIDNFKKINDTYGHNMGDRVLIEMSKFVKTLIRENDYLFRVGGEEFVIILSETNLEHSKSVSEKICKEVSKLLFIEGETITISMGLTEVKDGDTEDSIYKRVDSLLYYSKLNGKNRVSTHIEGDMMYGYFFDEERNTLYEKISGNFMNLEPFRETLMDEEFMKKYLSYEYIITDFRGFNMNFDHFEDEVKQLFLEYKKHFDSNEIKTKKVSTYI